MAANDGAPASRWFADVPAVEAAKPEPSPDSHHSSSIHTDKDDADTCRICRGEGSADEPLFFPCKCSGSIKYVHQECLMEWLSHTQKKHCELCKTSFRFTKLYHPGMPNRIPTTIFVRRAAMHVVNMFLTWCRAVLVTCVWLLLLPWCMRVVWRSLFWVGDGGWTPDMYLDSQQTENPRLSPFNLTALRPRAEPQSTLHANHTHTFWTPFFPLSFTSYNASVSETVIWAFAKRFLFGLPLPLASISMSDANQTSINTTSDPLGIRSPSLLSDVSFFNWFDSQAANRFIIDVLEGQIITLLVVVAFILIFLIREWVVQQQPVINMVAIGDNAAAQRAVIHEVEAQRDAAVEDDEDRVEDVENEELAVTNNAHVPLQEENPETDDSALRPRPQQEEDMPQESTTRNVLHESDTALGTYAVEINEVLANARRPEHNTGFESKSRTLDLGNTQAPLPSGTSSRPAEPAEDATDSDSAESRQRPIMPERDRSFIATGIRRSLEEGNDWSFENVPKTSQSESSGSHDVPNAWDDGETQDTPAGSSTDSPSDQEQDQEQDSEHSSESWQQVVDVIAEYDSDQVLEGTGPRNKGKARAVDEDASVPSFSEVHGDKTNSVDGADGNEVDDSTRSEHDTESSFDFDSSDISGEEEPQPADATTNPVDATQEVPTEAAALPQPPANLLDRTLEWMFGDVAPAIPATEEPRNDEHVVRNLAEEAPFVPFVGNEPPELANALAQDPEVAAAAAQAGIDVNDQEAIEDAEDLEGILELIGMQGPIVGLFQNVLFSAVLISATLACAVWIPYLWGKTVILFMGSPIALMIKLPLQIIATLTDLVVDFALLVMAGLTYWGSQLVSSTVHLCTPGSLPQLVDGRLATISATMRVLAEGAMDRIGKVFAESPLSPRPDYFRLSVHSHVALRSLQNSTSSALHEAGSLANAFVEQVSGDSPFRFIWRTITGVPSVLYTAVMWTLTRCNALLSWIWASKSYKITLDLDLGHNVTSSYTSLERWTANDRMIAIFAGYAFFAVMGAVYLKRGSPFSSSQQGQRIERIVSDVLQQAGGVLKVILIISIEMLAFPLYCGLLLDLAMLPLFQNATLYTRWQFACSSPWTSGFVHWFIGTCYMFHFALFVSMCRKIMRKGVLYFIRDPDDPTFHPVRDVLERSVTTQLRKIAFSALVYGALVIICLGGVVWTLSRATSGVLPIHWTTEAPSLEFPLDLLFYNFLTPVIIKAYKPSESIHVMYKWCFMKCAGVLRLSSFLFGGEIVSRDGGGGRFVRAPASDQARIPKGQPVFVEVDKDNVRKDGNTEGGVHNTELVTMVYIPNWFRVRIFAFVVTIWVLMGMSGVGITILPLLFGRYLFSFVLPDTVEMNDIHAFSLGVYTMGSIFYTCYHAYDLMAGLNRSIPSLETLQAVANTTSRVGLRVLRFTYVWAAMIFVIPFLFAIVIELYFLMPLHAYLGPKEPHVVHLIQDWTLGFLYSRIAARIIFSNRHSRPARAFNAVIRDGYLYPNARIATRCFLLPVLAVWLVAMAVPSSLAWTTSRTMYAGATEQTRNMVWRFSFPAVGLSLVAMWASKEAVRMLTRWRLVVRDEVYLIGERLHNFGEKKAPVQSRATEDAITKASLSVGPEGVVEGR
jgi:E3 ubiquitin-protein ligase MARCH6